MTDSQRSAPYRVSANPALAQQLSTAQEIVLKLSASEQVQNLSAKLDQPAGRAARRNDFAKHFEPRDGSIISVDPLVITRFADVIKMVVNARATGATMFAFRRQAAEIAPVVIGPEKRDVVGASESK